MTPRGEGGAAEGRWVVTRKSSPHMRLFCFPYAGGGASIYREWPRAMGEAVEVCAVRLPGREMRMAEPAIGTVDAMVDALLVALRPHQNVPFAFFGHSMGALIAHELTLRLLATGGPLPSALCVSARQAPHLPGPPRWKSISHLPEDEFVEVLGELNPASLDYLGEPSLRALLLPVLRADFALCESWRRREALPLPVPILALAGRADPSIPTEAVAQWSEHAADTFRFQEFDGGHFFVTDQTEAVCSVVRRELLALGPRAPRDVGGRVPHTSTGSGTGAPGRWTRRTET